MWLPILHRFFGGMMSALAADQIANIREVLSLRMHNRSKIRYIRQILRADKRELWRIREKLLELSNRTMRRGL